MTEYIPSNKQVTWNKHAEFRRDRNEKFGACETCNNGLDKMSARFSQTKCYDCRETLLKKQRKAFAKDLALYRTPSNFVSNLPSHIPQPTPASNKVN